MTTHEDILEELGKSYNNGVLELVPRRAWAVMSETSHMEYYIVLKLIGIFQHEDMFLCSCPSFRFFDECAKHIPRVEARAKS